jgi:hypothetical protein
MKRPAPPASSIRERGGNLMGSRDPEKPTAEVFAEVAEQTRLADELGYAIAWFAEVIPTTSNPPALSGASASEDDSGGNPGETELFPSIKGGVANFWRFCWGFSGSPMGIIRRAEARFPPLRC